ncbi:unnamed protein product [Boreogadus saida]
MRSSGPQLPAARLSSPVPASRRRGPPDVKIGNVAADLGLTAGTGNGDVTFALESGSEYFKIDNVTGELTTSTRRIDREKLPQCQMIFDENECFLDFELSVEENRPIGTLYLLPTATDRDFGRNGIDRYELIQDGGTGLGVSRRTTVGSPVTRTEGGPWGTGGPGTGENGGGARKQRFELQVADTPDGEKQPASSIVKGPLDRE